jgi:hypothetical protein
MLQNNQKVQVKNIEEFGTVVGYVGNSTYIVLWDAEPTDKKFDKIDPNHWRARAIYVDQIEPI